MSHSKGLFAGTCRGSYRAWGRPHNGYRQRVCGTCGHVQRRKVSGCVFFHDWKKEGRARHGRQQKRCRKCGNTRTTEARPCFWFHRWHTCKKVNGVHCKNCAMPQQGVVHSSETRGRHSGEPDDMGFA